MYLCLISLVNREIKTKMCKQFSMVIKLEKICIQEYEYPQYILLIKSKPKSQNISYLDM